MILARLLAAEQETVFLNPKLVPDYQQKTKAKLIKRFFSLQR